MEKAKKAAIKMLPHIVLYIAIYYILPLIFLISDSKRLVVTAAVVQLFYINPVCGIILGAFFGSYYGFKAYYPAAAALLFIPAMPLIYGIFDFAYLVFYLISALLGLLIGGAFRYYSSKSRAARKDGAKASQGARTQS